MFIAIIPILVCIAGLLIFVLAKPAPDLKRIGEHMLWTGMLVTLLAVMSKTIRIF